MAKRTRSYHRQHARKGVGQHALRGAQQALTSVSPRPHANAFTGLGALRQVVIERHAGLIGGEAGEVNHGAVAGVAVATTFRSCHGVPGFVARCCDLHAS